MNETTENDAKVEVDDTLLLQLREAQIEANRANERLEELKAQVQKKYFGSQILPVGESFGTVSGQTISLLDSGEKSTKLQVVDSEGNQSITVTVTPMGEPEKVSFDEGYLLRMSARLKIDFNRTFCDLPKFNPSKVERALEEGVISSRVYNNAKTVTKVERKNRITVKA